MEENSALYRVTLETGKFEELLPCGAWELAVKEKKIEAWLAQEPALLFSDKGAVKIIAREMAGEPQADLLAVDSQGNLFITEIKRDWSDRNTVGQILDYAARLSEWDYEAFNQRWKKYEGSEAGDLFEEFKKFVENPAFKKEDFLKEKRLYILAAETDESLKRIIEWLRSTYSVPIDYVPYSFFRQGDNVFLQIRKIVVEPMPYQATWAGDWFFNTDEKHSQGAYRRMFEQSVIAVWGWGHDVSKHKMDLPSKGERVFGYVNNKGIVAVGQVEEDKAFPANTVFSREDGDEYHRKVSWAHVVDLDEAVTASECSEWGYNLPVRCTIGKMSNSRVAEQIARELAIRSGEKKLGNKG